MPDDAGLGSRPDVWREASSVPGTLSPSDAFREQLESADILLDIGAGTGRVAASLRNFRGIVLSMDCSRTVLAGGAVRSLGEFRIAGDARWLPIRSGSVSQVSIQAVLTVIPAFEVRQLLIAEVRRSVRLGGSVYIGDFLLNDGSSYYRSRYSSGPGGGVFNVLDEAGRFLYQAKHWDVDELKSEWSRWFSVQNYACRTVASRSGRMVNGVELLLRRVR